MRQKLELPESFDKRLAAALQKESLQSWIDKETHHGWDPRDNIIAVVRSPEKSTNSGKILDYIKKFMYGKNVVTNQGDIFYAQQAVTEAPAANTDFEAGRMELQNPGIQDTPAKADTYSSMTTPITASRKLFETTPNYPLRNDADADNTGAGVDIVSYLVNYTTADFMATGINGGSIHDNAAPAGGTLLLTHWSITAFAKSASDTLKMFVNHTMDGQL